MSGQVSILVGTVVNTLGDVDDITIASASINCIVRT